MVKAADFDPYSDAFTADPYPVYARLRTERPALYSDALGMTLFSRYHDILALLRDPRLGRAPLGDETPLPLEQMPHYRRYVSRNLLEREGETHSRLRSVFAQLLTPQRIAALAPLVERRASALVAAAAAVGTFDLLAAVAVPLTVHTIADLMGWPEAGRERLRPWSAAIVRIYERDATDTHAMAAEQASAAFAEAVAELLRERLRAPRDDLLSRLASFETEGALSRAELISSCMLLLNAGHEATVNAAGNGVLALLRHPEALARLRQERCFASTVEEMLRYDAPLQLFHRFVYEDCRFAGVSLRRGDRVGLLYGSANRDPAAFRDAEDFDIGRRPNRHLGFGAGTHFCMGAPLARLELQTLLQLLVDRLPELTLVDTEPTHRGGFVFRGLVRLRLATTGYGAQTDDT